MTSRGWTSYIVVYSFYCSNSPTLGLLRPDDVPAHLLHSQRDTPETAVEASCVIPLDEAERIHRHAFIAYKER